MRRGILVLVVAIVAAACGGTDEGSTDANAEMMAAALVELVTVDHTFGEGPAPFSEYLIQNRIDPSAGDPMAQPGENQRQLTESERRVIESAFSDLGPVRWIEDPADWQTDDLMPTVEGAAILGVGEPDVDGDSALVPVSMWCGGLCGTWLTYELGLVDDVWTVTGIEGPIAIS